MKYYIFLLTAYLGLVGCSEEPTTAQLAIVDQLIQKQIDIPYEDPNWGLAEDYLLKNGETVNDAAKRNKRLYTDVHEFLIKLKDKPYEDKEIWAINMLEAQIEGLEQNLNNNDNPDKELVLLIKK